MTEATFRDIVLALILAAQGVIVAWINRVHQNVKAAKEAMVTLEKNTNSIKDALVETTGQKERAIGKLEGRAELRAERMRSVNEEEAEKPDEGSG